jgi:hypothetical protein
MGCLNSTGNFKHWFGNIHFSGPCNRSCYFCIGQHMMALDGFNNLNKWPLDGLTEFIETCNLKGIREVNLTGSNTDPMLFEHLQRLNNRLRTEIKNPILGIRTNGELVLRRLGMWNAMFDKASISFPCFDEYLYRRIMGGTPPDIEKIVAVSKMPIKINIVLCPENADPSTLADTLVRLQKIGVKKVNLREPYGQPHIGDPMVDIDAPKIGEVYGMPLYSLDGMNIVYWDVHYVEVESVNLYANGVVSKTYPITKGHDPVSGKVEDQSHFKVSGRLRKQWVTK